MIQTKGPRRRRCVDFTGENPSFWETRKGTNGPRSPKFPTRRRHPALARAQPVPALARVQPHSRVVRTSTVIGTALTPEPDLAEVLAPFGLRGTGPATPVANSVRNQNYRVPTRSGFVFVRLHEPTRSRDRLELNMAALAHARRHGLPVPTQHSTLDDEPLWWTGSQYASVADWMHGVTWRADEIDDSRAVALGSLLGATQLSLRAFDDSRLQTVSELRWNVAKSIEDLTNVVQELRGAGISSRRAARLLDDVVAQRRVLETGVVPEPTDPEVDVEVVHGDYHERNVLTPRVSVRARDHPGRVGRRVRVVPPHEPDEHVVLSGCRSRGRPASGRLPPARGSAQSPTGRRAECRCLRDRRPDGRTPRVTDPDTHDRTALGHAGMDPGVVGWCVAMECSGVGDGPWVGRLIGVGRHRPGSASW